MNLLFTLNIGGVLTPNARQSIASAADRWGCEYLEVKDLAWKDCHPCATKLMFLAERAQPWKRIIYMDADMLVRSDAPSPLDSVPDHLVGGVCDYQSHYDEKLRLHIEDAVHRNHFAHLKEAGADFNADDLAKRPFNGGFLVCSNHHAWIFERACKTLRRNPSLDGHVEQLCLNHALYESGMKHEMDNCWNRIAPDVNKPMADYIYHFTGSGFGEKRNAIKTFRWDITSASPDGLSRRRSGSAG